MVTLVGLVALVAAGWAGAVAAGVRLSFTSDRKVNGWHSTGGALKVLTPSEPVSIY